MTNIEIVWRNPQPVKQTQRKQSLEESSDHAFYAVQELVEDGYLSYWTTICDFEVLEKRHFDLGPAHAR